MIILLFGIKFELIIIPSNQETSLIPRPKLIYFVIFFL
jgi:hypothetical protein